MTPHCIRCGSPEVPRDVHLGNSYLGKVMVCSAGCDIHHPKKPLKQRIAEAPWAHGSTAKLSTLQ